MKRIQGCELEPIDGAQSVVWLDYVLGRGAAPALLDASAWLLCHCDDGVTWGRLEASTWLLGSTVFPDLCPQPSALVLQELRIFSAGIEIMLWRTEQGLRGRALRDSPVEDVSCSPHDDQRLLLAGRVAEHKDGFTRVGNGSGAEQALPLRVVEGPSQSWPRLHVRHYFERDEATGSVRVAVTRLVEVA